MSEKMADMLSLIQRAEKMEYTNEEMALKLYIELFDEYEPQMSKPYTGAIRLMEKRDMLQEALDIANRAIEMCEADRMSAGSERFEDLAARIKKKMKDTGYKPKSGAKKSNANNIKLIIIIVVAILAIAAASFLASPYGQIFINFDEKQGVIEGGELDAEGRPTTYKKYPITQKMVDYTISNAERNEDAEAVNIVVDGRTIGIAVVTYHSDMDTGKKIVSDALFYLAKAASNEYSDLEGPSNETLGGIYEHYDLVITVGTGVAESSFYLRGTMNAGGKKVIYKEDHQKD